MMKKIFPYSKKQQCMKTIKVINLLFVALTYNATSQVTFIIDSLPSYTPPGDTLYIAGDFQGWNPGSPDWALDKNADGKWFIMLEEAPAGTTIQYKFTRGDWGKVEKGEFGEEIPNRLFTFGNVDTVHHAILNWADISGGQTTAAENVHIMDEEFYMPQLDRHRRIWVYLPPGYEESDDHYPVIYMQDGQNLFDLYTSYAGEWEVDETLNDLYDQGYQVPIVVGIDNGGNERLNEYTPWVNSQYGGGQGDQYMAFIVETLKPYIDEHYRTIPTPESTALWGSSLGGLISFYGIMAYQEVFGKAGIYSPSYWWSGEVWTFAAQAGIQEELVMYQMTGELEGGSMVEDTWAMHDLLTNMGMGEQELFTTITEGGEHNEALWRGDFGDAYLWLFHSFANSITEQHVMPLSLSPNPARDLVQLAVQLNRGDQLLLYSPDGKTLKLNGQNRGNVLDVSTLASGLYIIELRTGDAVYRGKLVRQ